MEFVITLLLMGIMVCLIVLLVLIWGIVKVLKYIAAIICGFFGKGT